MGKTIDITSRIKDEPKFVKIGEKSYKVDDRKNTVLEVMQELDKSGANDVQNIDRILAKLIGKGAVKDFENYSLEDYRTVYIAVMAVIQGVSYEECEKSFRGG